MWILALYLAMFSLGGAFLKVEKVEVRTFEKYEDCKIIEGFLNDQRGRKHASSRGEIIKAKCEPLEAE
jgi:hypothetical protein